MTVLNAKYAIKDWERGKSKVWRGFGSNNREGTLVWGKYALCSAVLISDSLYKNRAMCRKQIALLLFATKFGPQEVDSLNQLQG